MTVREDSISGRDNVIDMDGLRYALQRGTVWSLAVHGVRSYDRKLYAKVDDVNPEYFGVFALIEGDYLGSEGVSIGDFDTADLARVAAGKLGDALGLPVTLFVSNSS